MSSKKKGSNNNNGTSTSTTPAASLQEQILSQGKPVSAEVAGVLEGEYSRVETAEKPATIGGLVIEPATPVAVEDQPRDLVGEILEEAAVGAGFKLDAAEQQAPADELAVETTNTTTPENETMEHVINENVEATNEAIAAAQPQPGMIGRSWNWLKNNKGKVALGATALVGVGVGIYYLTRGGDVAKVAEVAATAATTVAETATDAVA